MIALLIDIGNSRIKWRIARIDPQTPQPHWLIAEQVLASSKSTGIADLFSAHADLPVDRVWCSNVASDTVESAVRAAVARAWRNATVHAARAAGRQCGVVNGYREPTRLGPDRWMAMIGAHVRCPSRTLLVCSFGTATTIDLLVADRDPSSDDAARFVGGLILPGFDAMRAALSTSTARLPIAEGRIVDFADNTDDAIVGGIAAAQLGAVSRALLHARHAVGQSPAVTCVLAGGGASRMAPLLGELDATVDVAHDLVLLGLAAVAREAASSAAQRPADLISTR